jgi:hypothetical protein
MNRLDELMNEYRMGNIIDDCGGINRLFGLKDLIFENLNESSVVCEIGSYEGKSSELFAMFCKTIYCVDVFIDSKYTEKFDIMMKNYKNIIKIKNLSVVASSDFPDDFFDCVYIDANHDYDSVKEDILHWKDKIKNNGFISGHDYYFNAGGVSQAVNEIFKNEKENIKIYSDSSWILKINK